MTAHRLRSMDWLLRDLTATVPGIQHVVVLSSDGLCMARYNIERAGGERIAAAAAGIRSLARSLATEFPPHLPRLPRPRTPGGVEVDDEVRMVVLELAGGLFYLMSAGGKSYLAVTASHETDPGLVGNRLRDLVLRLGEHLPSAACAPEQAAP